MMERDPQLFELLRQVVDAPQVVPMAELERWYILEVLQRFDGNRTHTARALGIGANTLWRKLKSWGVPPARDPNAAPPSGDPDPRRPG
jgi:DNA-binding NtrC family response regulator